MGAAWLRAEPRTLVDSCECRGLCPLEAPVSVDTFRLRTGGFRWVTDAGVAHSGLKKFQFTGLEWMNSEYVELAFGLSKR